MRLSTITLAVTTLLFCTSAPAMAADATAANPASGNTVEATSNAASTSPSAIFLLARIKLTGTDFTQVFFLRHNAITNLAACEAERQAGLTTGWNHFSRYFLQTLKGISYKVDYRCVESDLQLAAWRKGMPMDKFYLIQTLNNRLNIQPQRNFFECRDALRAVSQTESIDAFCGISSQAILKQAPDAQ